MIPVYLILLKRVVAAPALKLLYAAPTLEVFLAYCFSCCGGHCHVMHSLQVEGLQIEECMPHSFIPPIRLRGPVEGISAQKRIVIPFSVFRIVNKVLPEARHELLKGGVPQHRTCVVLQRAISLILGSLSVCGILLQASWGARPGQAKNDKTGALPSMAFQHRGKPRQASM